MKQAFAIGTAVVLTLLWAANPAGAAEPMAGYLMGYFTESPSRLGDSRALHLAVSDDALNWMPLNQNKAVLVPELGEKGLRDPFFLRKPDGGFVVLATNLGDNLMAPFPTIHVWDTDDFITFKDARLVTMHDTQMRTWAPETFWDPQKKKYGIVWSGNTDYYRTYVNYTDDFVTVGPHELYFDPGYNQIDATFFHGEGTDGGWEQFLYFKDWTKSRLRGARSRSLAPRSFDRNVYTPQLGNKTAETLEAPLLVKDIAKKRWYLYGDSYRPINNEFYCWQTDDIAKGAWKELSKAEYNPPLNCKHGTIIPVTRAEMDRLVERWGKPEWNRIKSFDEPDFFVRHEAFKGKVSAYPFDPYTDSQWKVVPGLSDAKGVSFESLGFPGHYLRHQGTDVTLAQSDDGETFKASATFIKEKGLADAKASSFRAADAPGQYLRHAKEDLRVEAVPSAADKADATFLLVY